MGLRERLVQGIAVACCLLLTPAGAWADKLTDLEQAFETQQKSLQQLQQEMQRLRQERSTQQAETDRRVMEVEKKAAEAAASSLLTGYEPGKGFYLKSADGQFKLNLGGYLQTWAQVEGSFNAGDNPSLTPAEKATAGTRHNPSTFKERRIRLLVTGQLFNDFNFHIQPEFSFGGVGSQPPGGASTGGARLEEGWLSYTYAPWAKVIVGQHKPRFGLEMLTSSADLDFADRAVISRALSPEEQLGATIEGNWKLPLFAEIPVYYGVSIYNGCGRIDQCPGGIDNDGDKAFAGRLTFAPPMPWGNLTVGLNADRRTFRIKNGKGATDANGVTAPISGTSFYSFNPVQATGWKLAGSLGGSTDGFRINGERITGGGDIVWDFYPFMIKGEYAYATQERDKLGAGGAALDNLIMQGGYGTIGYWVFGNKRSGLQAIGRYEHIRVDDRTGAFNAPTSDPGEHPLEMRSGTLGLNWYVNPSVRLRANYILTDVRPHRNVIGVSNNERGELVHEGIAEVQLLF